MDSLGTIYQKHNKKIFNLAFRMTGSIDEANDITQETFIQAFHSLEDFKGESSISTWLYKIAKNLCIHYLKKKQKSSFVSLQQLIERTSSPVPEEISEAEKMQYILQVKDGCLSGLLRCLSLQQRLAFILAVLLDLPVDQVALVIDKSENATRILIHRAKQNIREFLCYNCSLYQSNNTCRCENLINFSLKKGWISLDETSVITQVETEIKDLKNEVSLYRTLHEKDTTVNKQLQEYLAHKDFLILSDKKVK